MEEITVNLDNLTAEEREQLMKLVEKGSKKPLSKVWKPAKHEEYQIITSDGAVGTSKWHNDWYDNNRYEIGNVFPSEEAAEEEATRRKMLTKWKRLSIEAGEEENPWDYKHSHWCVYADPNGIIEFGENLATISGITTFPTEESLKAAVAELGEENVKKYILGVKE